MFSSFLSLFKRLLLLSLFIFLYLISFHSLVVISFRRKLHFYGAAPSDRNVWCERWTVPDGGSTNRWRWKLLILLFALWFIIVHRPPTCRCAATVVLLLHEVKSIILLYNRNIKWRKQEGNSIVQWAVKIGIYTDNNANTDVCAIVTEIIQVYVERRECVGLVLHAKDVGIYFCAALHKLAGRPICFPPSPYVNVKTLSDCTAGWETTSST